MPRCLEQLVSDDSDTHQSHFDDGGKCFNPRLAGWGGGGALDATYFCRGGIFPERRATFSVPVTNKP